MRAQDDRPADARRPDLKDALERDLRRYGRREPGQRAFWQSLSVLGSVGWPIVLTTVGGALIGHWIDTRWGTGVRLTLTLMLTGAVAGGAIAWHLIQPRSR